MNRVKKIGIFFVLMTLAFVSYGLANYKISQQLNIFGKIEQLLVSPDNQTLAAALKNNTLVVFEKQNGCYPEEPSFSCEYDHYKFSLDWQYLAVLTNENDIILHSKKDGVWNAQIISDVGSVYDFKFLDSNEYLFIKTQDTLKIFNTNDCSEINNSYAFDLLRSNKNKNIAICGYTVSPDNESIATTNTQNNELQIYKNDHVNHQLFTFVQNKIIKYKFSQNSQMLAVLTTAGNLFLFRKNNAGRWLYFQKINKNVITNFCFSQNGIAVFNQETQHYILPEEGFLIFKIKKEKRCREIYHLTTFKYENGIFIESNNYSSYSSFYPILNAPITIQKLRNSINIIDGHGDHWQVSNSYKNFEDEILSSSSSKELITLSFKNSSLNIYKIEDGQINSLPFAQIQCPDIFYKIYDVYFLDNTNIVIRLKANSPWFYGEDSNQIIILSNRETQMKSARK